MGVYCVRFTMGVNHRNLLQKFTAEGLLWVFNMGIYHGSLMWEFYPGSLLWQVYCSSLQHYVYSGRFTMGGLPQKEWIG